MLIGIPGCGKTTFCKKFLPNLTRISRDEIRNTKKEHEIIEKTLQNKQDFVIDDINATTQSRSKIISIIKQYNAEITGIFFNFSVNRCLSQNIRRENPLPDAAIGRWNKELMPPSKDEGFNYVQILDENFRF